MTGEDGLAQYGLKWKVNRHVKPVHHQGRMGQGITEQEQNKKHKNNRRGQVGAAPRGNIGGRPQGLEPQGNCAGKIQFQNKVEPGRGIHFSQKDGGGRREGQCRKGQPRGSSSPKQMLTPKKEGQTPQIDQPNQALIQPASGGPHFQRPGNPALRPRTFCQSGRLSQSKIFQ